MRTIWRIYRKKHILIKYLFTMESLTNFSKKKKDKSYTYSINLTFIILVRYSINACVTYSNLLRVYHVFRDLRIIKRLLVDSYTYSFHWNLVVLNYMKYKYYIICTYILYKCIYNYKRSTIAWIDYYENPSLYRISYYL